MMKKLAYALAVATGAAVIAGHAVAQDAPTPASPGSAPDTSATCGSAGDTGSGTISASSGSGSAAQNLKVYSCNGVRVGTAVSTTTGPNGTVLTVSPDANFLNGVTTFQITAKGATLGEGQI